MTRKLGFGYLAMTACLAAASNGWANMTDNSHRSQVAGIDLITYQTNVKQVVIIVGALPAGDAMAGPDNIAIPTLTGMMLDRGTKTLDKFAIAKQLDDVGAEISFGVGAQSLEIRAKCLKKDMPLVLRLVAAELRDPAMLAAEFAKAKQQFVGNLQDAMHNTEERAQEAFDRAIFPPGHPNRPHSLEEFLAAAKSATLDQAKAFHARYYGPAHLTLVLAGDVPVEEAQAEIAKDFAGWTGGQDFIHAAGPAVPRGPATVVVPIKDKPSVSVILGQPTGLRYRDPDALPLRVGTAILGRGFTGRLMRIVRDKEGLTYNIDAEVSNDSIADGAWSISASFAPALLERGLTSTRSVLANWWQDGVTEDELAVRKQGILGTYLVGLATTRGLASIILTTVQRGYGLDWLDAYPQMVQALTRDQVNKAIRTHLDPSTMVLIEAGSVSAGGKPAADAAPPAR
ncbi:MAG: M16 family metallopeptidase [Steroidobacteraceae bacterium]